MRHDRVALYRLIGQALAYPDLHFVSRLKETIGKVNLNTPHDPLLPLGVFIHELDSLRSMPLDKVQGEHTRLFINAYPRVPCPPYESAYRDGELMSRSAEEVDRVYRQWGVVVDGEQVDHAGAELEFVAFLLAMDTPQAMEAAQAFRSEHLLPWLPRLADDMARESRIGFYQATGLLLSAILQAEI